MKKTEKFTESKMGGGAKYLKIICYVLAGVLLTIITFYILSIWYFNNLENQILEQQTNTTTTSELISIYLEDENGDYVYSTDSSFPTVGYTFNEEKSYCINESTLSWSGTQITVNTKGSDNCYVYFDELPPLLYEQILMNEEDAEGNTFSSVDDATTYINSKTTPTFSSTATIDEGIFATSDNDGISYYFRGATEDNYIEFAGMLWRIIRIDGLGNIKLMLYNEDSESSSYQEYGITGSYDVTFNATTWSANYNEGTGSNDAKIVVETWYDENLTDDSDYLVETKMCVEMDLVGDFYPAGVRLYNNWSSSSASPSLLCDDDDEYSYTAALITADEIAFAGGVVGTTNSSYYLKTGYDYWSGSAFSYDNGFGAGFSFLVYSSGSLSDDHVGSGDAVFPSVSLSSEINFTEGSGIKTDPYVVG